MSRPDIISVSDVYMEELLNIAMLGPVFLASAIMFLA